MFINGNWITHYKDGRMDKDLTPLGKALEKIDMQQAEIDVLKNMLGINRPMVTTFMGKDLIYWSSIQRKLDVCTRALDLIHSGGRSGTWSGNTCADIADEALKQLEA